MLLGNRSSATRFSGFFKFAIFHSFNWPVGVFVVRHAAGSTYGYSHRGDDDELLKHERKYIKAWREILILSYPHDLKLISTVKPFLFVVVITYVLYVSSVSTSYCSTIL